MGKKKIILIDEKDFSNVKSFLKDSNISYTDESKQGKVFNQRYLLIPLIILFILSTFVTVKIFAEQTGSSPESGTDSKFTQLYDDLVDLGIGTEGSGEWGDWGTRWNRVMSASKRDLVNYEAMSLQERDYVDAASYGSDSWSSWQRTNDTLGENVYLDTRTGLYWSPGYASLSNSFTRATCSYFTTQPRGTYDGSDTDCGNAINYCGMLSLDGDNDGTEDTSWYLPSQVELMQAYVNGIYRGTDTTWVPSTATWSCTEVTTTTARAYFISLQTGAVINNTGAKTDAYSVRCVLRDLN